MRLIIEARLEGSDPANSASTEPATIVAVVERQDQSVVGLGLTLTEGRALLAEVQSVLVSHHTESWMADQRYVAAVAPCSLTGQSINHDTHGHR